MIQIPSSGCSNDQYSVCSQSSNTFSQFSYSPLQAVPNISAPFALTLRTHSQTSHTPQCRLYQRAVLRLRSRQMKVAMNYRKNGMSGLCVICNVPEVNTRNHLSVSRPVPLSITMACVTLLLSSYQFRRLSPTAKKSYTWDFSTLTSYSFFLSLFLISWDFINFKVRHCYSIRLPLFRHLI